MRSCLHPKWHFDSTGALNTRPLDLCRSGGVRRASGTVSQKILIKPVTGKIAVHGRFPLKEHLTREASMIFLPRNSMLRCSQRFGVLGIWADFFLRGEDKRRGPLSSLCRAEESIRRAAEKGIRHCYFQSSRLCGSCQGRSDQKASKRS